MTTSIYRRIVGWKGDFLYRCRYPGMTKNSIRYKLYRNGAISVDVKSLVEYKILKK